MVSWWDTEVPHPTVRLAKKQQAPNEATSSADSPRSPNSIIANPMKDSDEIAVVEDTTSGVVIFHGYYAKAVDRILKPFFFVRH
jgi:hypothetical protein